MEDIEVERTGLPLPCPERCEGQQAQAEAAYMTIHMVWQRALPDEYLGSTKLITGTARLLFCLILFDRLVILSPFLNLHHVSSGININPIDIFSIPMVTGDSDARTTPTCRIRRFYEIFTGDHACSVVAVHSQRFF